MGLHTFPSQRAVLFSNFKKNEFKFLLIFFFENSTLNFQEKFKEKKIEELVNLILIQIIASVSIFCRNNFLTWKLSITMLKINITRKPVFCWDLGGKVHLWLFYFDTANVMQNYSVDSFHILYFLFFFFFLLLDSHFFKFYNTVFVLFYTYFSTNLIYKLKSIKC